ncbi:unnamed protein product [Urochloa humidicola]
MDMVTGATGSIGPKLLELLKDEYKLHKDLSKEVKYLSDELESVHVALRKVAEVPWDMLGHARSGRHPTTWRMSSTDSLCV